MIKIIFCDIGGVLLHIDPDKTVSFWAQKAGVTEDYVRDNFPLEIHHEYEKGRLDDHEFYVQVKKSMNLNGLTEKDFWQGWRDLVGDATDVWSFTKQMAPNTPIWLLSNTNPKHILDDLKEEHSFFQEVDGTVYSFEVDARKPDSDIFSKACLMTGTQPENALFIDDMKENIAQAQAMGFHTIHYTDHQTFKQELTKKVELFD
ncbi:MAG: HAD family phosphatase [Candidatus Marinimicrobia bacterium]|nr:HAD family phosphatase [Candidatus Neomarinimicrobiota bacterium]